MDYHEIFTRVFIYIGASNPQLLYSRALYVIVCFISRIVDFFFIKMWSLYVHRSLGKRNQNAVEMTARWNFDKRVKIPVAFCERCKNLGGMFHHHTGIFPLARSLVRASPHPKQW